MGKDEAREWRRIAVMGAAGVALVTAPLWFARRPAAAVREFLSGQPVDEAGLFTETPAQEVMRRLAAVEAHLQNLPPERA